MGAVTRSFWRDRGVIVTGGTGFLGSYVVERLKAAGAGQLLVPASREYDLRDVAAVRRLLAQSAAMHPSHSTVIIHLAARVGGIGANRARPAEFFYDNLLMGVQLMHEAWQAGIGKFVAVGTICAYPKYAEVPFREDHLWDGYPEETNAPYGLAKKMLLVQGQAYRQQYDWPVIYLLPVNLYGPRDHADPESSHVIPALVRKCLEAQAHGEDRIVVWGDGSPTREFLYADDCAEAILLAAERYDKPEPVNLGTGREISIKALATLIAELTGFRGEIVWDASRPNGQPRRCVDTSRARREFGFQASTPLEEGLRRTIEWMRLGASMVRL